MAAPISLTDGKRSRQADSRCSSGNHLLRPMGTVPGRDAAGVDCDQPVLLVCGRPGCGLTRHLPCKNSRASVCKRCSVRYGRRVRAVVESGLKRRSGRFRYFITITAIGDRAHCKKPGCDRAPYCNHEQCPCTTGDSPDLATWNSNHSKYWNHFLTRMRREYPGLQFFRGVEVQEGAHRADKRGRGALHDHFIADSHTPVSEAVVRRLAMAAGFGHSVKVVPVARGSRREAYYVAKYITKAADQRQIVPWRADVVDTTTGELHEGVIVAGRYRTWSSSVFWGETMTRLAYSAWWQWAIAEQERQGTQAWAAMSVLATAFGVQLAGPEPP